MNEEQMKLLRDTIKEEQLLAKERDHWNRCEESYRQLQEEKSKRTEPFQVTYLFS